MSQSHSSVYMFPAWEEHRTVFADFRVDLADEGLQVFTACKLPDALKEPDAKRPLAIVTSVDEENDYQPDEVALGLVEQAHESGVRVVVLQLQERNLGRKMLDLVAARTTRSTPDFLDYSGGDASFLVDKGHRNHRTRRRFLEWFKYLNDLPTVQA